MSKQHQKQVDSPFPSTSHSFWNNVSDQRAKIWKTWKPKHSIWYNLELNSMNFATR